jgi:hypothetical protein
MPNFLLSASLDMCTCPSDLGQRLDELFIHALLPHDGARTEANPISVQGPQFTIGAKMARY